MMPLRWDREVEVEPQAPEPIRSRVLLPMEGLRVTGGPLEFRLQLRESNIHLVRDDSRQGKNSTSEFDPPSVKVYWEGSRSFDTLEAAEQWAHEFDLVNELVWILRYSLRVRLREDLQACCDRWEIPLAVAPGTRIL